MSQINIFEDAEKAAKLLKLKSVNGNLTNQAVQKLSKLKKYLIDKYDSISRDKNTISQELIKNISVVENSVYRYETLKKAGLAQNINPETGRILNSADKILNYSSKLSSEPVLLEGAVSNAKYVWHSSEGCCDACKALDGTEYVLKEDIPQKPHPNCKCTVEMIKDDSSEPCNCHSLYERIDNISDNVETVMPELEDIKNTVNEILVICANMPAASIGYQILDEINIAEEAFHDFQRNKAEMIAWKGFDKYYHAKANCEASRRGLSGEAVAYLASIGKEIVDIYTKTKSKKLTFIEAIKDSMEDLQADFYGIEQSTNDGSCGVNVENVGNIINKFD